MHSLVLSFRHPFIHRSIAHCFALCFKPTRPTAVEQWQCAQPVVAPGVVDQPHTSSVFWREVKKWGWIPLFFRLTFSAGSAPAADLQDLQRSHDRHHKMRPLFFASAPLKKRYTYRRLARVSDTPRHPAAIVFNRDSVNLGNTPCILCPPMQRFIDSLAQRKSLPWSTTYAKMLSLPSICLTFGMSLFLCFNICHMRFNCSRQMLIARPQ